MARVDALYAVRIKEYVQIAIVAFGFISQQAALSSGVKAARTFFMLASLVERYRKSFNPTLKRSTIVMNFPPLDLC